LQYFFAVVGNYEQDYLYNAKFSKLPENKFIEIGLLIIILWGERY